MNRHLTPMLFLLTGCTSDTGTNHDDPVCAVGTLWECSDHFEAPCDGKWWDEAFAYDGDVAAFVANTKSFAAGYVDQCDVSKCPPMKEGWQCESATCATDGVQVAWTRSFRLREEKGTYGGVIKLVDEDVDFTLTASAEDWQEMVVSSTVRPEEESHTSTFDVAWVGKPFETAPPDQSMSHWSWTWWTDNGSWGRESWASDGCVGSIRDEGHSGLSSTDLVHITVPKSELQVLYSDADCDWATQAAASLDSGKTHWKVDADTWQIIGDDNDVDGWTTEEGDCDDDDPARTPCEGCEEAVASDGGSCAHASGLGMWWLSMVALLVTAAEMIKVGPAPARKPNRVVRVNPS